MSADRRFAVSTAATSASSGPKPSGRAWHARAAAPATLYLATAAYALATLTWAAAGNGDVRFAETAALVGALAAVVAFAAASIAAAIARPGRIGPAMRVIAAGAAAGAAAQIAALAVVTGSNAIGWNPPGMQLLAALSPVALLGSLLVDRRRGWGDPRRFPDLLAFASLALGSVSLGLALLRLLGSDGGRWRLALAGVALAAGATAATAVRDPMRRAAGAGWLLLCASWSAAALAPAVAAWSGSGARWLALGRWLLPIGALALVVIAAQVIGLGSRRMPALGALAPARVRSNATRATVAGVALAALAVAVAARWAPDTALDTVLVAALALAAAIARLGVSLAAERSLVAQLSDAAREWQRVASIDPLTALPNRAALTRRLKEEVERSLRYDQPLTVCFVDADRFKGINDEYGHAAGDLVLREIGERLRSTARIIDVVGRYGGEEFLVIAPGTWTEDALVLAGRLRARVEGSPVVIDAGTEIPVTISVGVAGLPEHADTLERLLERADAALYAAKRQGRNRVVLFDPSEMG